MLVIERYPEEAIIINGNIKVKVCQVRGDKVKLGIEAPKEIPVHREEIQQAIEREKSLCVLFEASGPALLGQ